MAFMLYLNYKKEVTEMSQQQTRLVLLVAGQRDIDPLSVKVQTAAELVEGAPVCVITVPVNPRAWWLKPDQKSSLVELLFDIKPTLSYKEATKWLKTSAFIEFVSGQLVGDAFKQLIGLPGDTTTFVSMVVDETINRLQGDQALVISAVANYLGITKRLTFVELEHEHMAHENYAGPNLAAFDQDLIEELDLGVRSYNCLKRAGIQTIGELLQMSERELSTIPNIERKCIDEVIEVLGKRGHSLRQK